MSKATSVNSALAAKPPVWFRVIGILGLAWNLFGVIKFFGAIGSTKNDLITQGLTPEQAEVMTTYPTWMTVVFAVGVFGGTIGSMLLVLRRKASVLAFAGSLVSYIALYIGDYTEGVFAAMGSPQVIILTIVVMIAVALFSFSLASIKRMTN